MSHTPSQLGQLLRELREDRLDVIQFDEIAIGLRATLDRPGHLLPIRGTSGDRIRSPRCGSPLHPSERRSKERRRHRPNLLTDLIARLRSKGVVSRTPLHTLRKEFGSQINLRYGLTAASGILRHAGVSITAAHYIEVKQRPVLGFGHLLKGERTIIPIGEASGT